MLTLGSIFPPSVSSMFQVFPPKGQANNVKIWGNKNTKRTKKIKINFNDAINGGVKYKIEGANVFVINKSTRKCNLGVIISKKVSNLAVVRNKYRRILKEIFRLDFKLLEYKDLVFIVNKKILDLDFNRIRKELSKVRKYMFNEKIDSVIVDNAN